MKEQQPLNLITLSKVPVMVVMLADESALALSGKLDVQVYVRQKSTRFQFTSTALPVV
jgi:hypothetical protein